MVILNSHAQIVIPQFESPYVLTGVTLAMKVILSNFTPFARLIGIRIPHPITDKARNMFRHIFKILKNTTASNPISGMSSCSFVFAIGANQANTPFPIGGGECFSSATLSFGAYTTELYGRRREKPIARRSVKPIEVPKLAYTDDCASYWQLVMSDLP